MPKGHFLLATFKKKPGLDKLAAGWFINHMFDMWGKLPIANDGGLTKDRIIKIELYWYPVALIHA